MVSLNYKFILMNSNNTHLIHIWSILTSTLWKKSHGKGTHRQTDRQTEIVNTRPIRPSGPIRWKVWTFLLCPVKDINISDIFYRIQKFLTASWDSIITTNVINFLMAGPFHFFGTFVTNCKCHFMSRRWLWGAL